MGMFDTIRVHNEAFICSEGHDLSNEEFQTKDLNETMSNWTINDRLHYDESSEPWGMLPDMPFLGRIDIYATCRQCPAFIQHKTKNLIGTGVEFTVEIIDNKVRNIKRTSLDTKQQLIDTPKEQWMQNCLGPMTYEEAYEISRNRYREDQVSSDSPEDTEV